jgi:hypothetical protein
MDMIAPPLLHERGQCAGLSWRSAATLAGLACVVLLTSCASYSRRASYACNGGLWCEEDAHCRIGCRLGGEGGFCVQGRCVACRKNAHCPPGQRCKAAWGECLADWQERYDLDGDDRPDTIHVQKAEAARSFHLALTLSSSRGGGDILVPFAVDLSGYPENVVDLSKPQRLAVEDVTGDGLPDLVLSLRRSPGQGPVPERLRRLCALTTDRVVISYAGGKMSCADATSW